MILIIVYLLIYVEKKLYIFAIYLYDWCVYIIYFVGRFECISRISNSLRKVIKGVLVPYKKE